nr:CBM_HP1_G0024400.mRNA.1.CDS.1 [Saccharomyces cerevisiae]
MTRRVVVSGRSYVNNEYDEEELRENPPAKVQVDHIVRNILAEKPRVTRFNIVGSVDKNEDGNDKKRRKIEGGSTDIESTPKDAARSTN